ncbi:hypothetical protein AAIB33_00260 [Microbacterium sp. AZCO]|uniref:hypothetical protein n=1 Tax=Microbacterium sp. AZCO TaxID=3142976 RepID=UPI0031F41DAF
MDAPSIILLAAGIIAVWAVIAVVIAIVLGRTAAASDHEARMGAMTRDMRAQDAAAAASVQKQDAAAAGSGWKVSRHPRS